MLIYVHETVEELRKLLAYAEKLQQRFELGREPSELLLDAESLAQRLNDVIDRLPDSKMSGNSRRHLGWMVRELGKGDARSCRSDIDDLVNSDIPGIIEKIEKWAKDHGEDSDWFKIRVRGLFPNMSSKQFIAESNVNAAYGRQLRPEQYEFAPKILILDPAWEGDDPLVISLRQGLMFTVLRRIPKNDNDVQMATLLAVLEDEHKADAVFIDQGYGTGIYSAGVTMQREWWLVNFADAAIDPGHLNKRAEMYTAAKNWLKAGGAIEEDPELRDELLSLETVPRLDGKVQLESKKEMKARGLPSPNKADTLAMSFAYPVQAKPRFPDGTPMVIRGNDQTGTNDFYNPLG